MSQLYRIVVVMGAVAAVHGCAPQAINRTGVASDRADGGDAASAGAEVGFTDGPGPLPGTGGMPVVRGTGGGPAVSGAGGAGGTGPVDMGRPPDLAVDRPGTGGSGAVDAPREVAPEVPAPADADAAGAMIASLVVADPTSNASADAKLKTLLMGKGFTVKIGDDDGMATQSDGTRFVVISGTCESAKLLMKYRNYPAPVLVLEGGVYDDMAMTLAMSGTDFGEEMGTQIAITDAANPLAAMFPAGNVTVASQSSKLVWGKPAPSAIKVATLTGANAMKVAVFAYERGALMHGNVAAPARRVAMFAGAPAIPNINANADKLLNAAIDWLLQ